MKSIWNLIKKAWEWLKSSYRLLHFLIGIVVGFGANSWYCATYVGLGVAGAMEGKDWQWGGVPDWVDFLLTFGSCMLSYFIKTLVL